jgi:hypothetical protein
MATVTIGIEVPATVIGTAGKLIDVDQQLIPTTAQHIQAVRCGPDWFTLREWVASGHRSYDRVRLTIAFTDEHAELDAEAVNWLARGINSVLSTISDKARNGVRRAS